MPKPEFALNCALEQQQQQTQIKCFYNYLRQLGYICLFVC